MNLAGAIARKSMRFAQRLASSTATGSMNSRVVIRRGGGWDPETYEYSPSRTTVIYDDPDTPDAGGIAGITVAQGGSQLDLGDEPQYFDSVTVFLPIDLVTQPMINDIVVVKDNPESDLIGRMFRVVNVPVGGRIAASTQLACTGIAPSREWTT